MMAPTKNLYVREDDVAVWERAETLAKLSRQSLSQIATTALREFMASPADIYVHLSDPEHPSDGPSFADAGGRPILSYPVGQRGRLGWKLWTPDGESTFMAGDALNPPLDDARGWLRARAAARDSADPLFDIAVAVGKPPQLVGFRGRWLVEPDVHQSRSVQDKVDKAAYWGVALTARGRIAVYVAHANDRWPARLDDYDSLLAA
ncbi:MAG: hypothetical protein ACM3JP_00155, partial [Betaproteobacteria bacterium]